VSVLLCSEIQMNIFVIVFLKLTSTDVMGLHLWKYVMG
jgi:hypothetical protein